MAQEGITITTIMCITTDPVLTPGAVASVAGVPVASAVGEAEDLAADVPAVAAASAAAQAAEDAERYSKHKEKPFCGFSFVMHKKFDVIFAEMYRIL